MNVDDIQRSHLACEILMIHFDYGARLVVSLICSREQRRIPVSEVNELIIFLNSTFNDAHMTNNL